MSDPNRPAGAEVDPSEDSIDEGMESLRASDADDEESAGAEVDPSEGPTE